MQKVVVLGAKVKPIIAFILINIATIYYLSTQQSVDCQLSLHKHSRVIHQRQLLLNDHSGQQPAFNSVGLLGSPILEPAIVLPSTEYDGNVTEDALYRSNRIDHKRFIESMSTRCFSSTLMDDPKLFEPSFYLFKPQAETRIRATTNPMEILQAGFVPTQVTFIFVHGFTQGYPDTVWLRHARALFERNKLTNEYNSIIMDWSRGSHQTFSQSAAIVSSMGAYLANFLQKLLELGADRNKIHLIGHSLGAHICGFAGKRIRNRIGRITALDAAGPCFGKVSSNGPSDRLTPDDAVEVDVYHYDDDFLGIGPNVQLGQHDIYVNGGSKQPGCKGNADAMFDAAITVITGRNRVLSESHTRSTEVATAQLADAQCQQVAYTCKNWISFTHGECGHCDRNNNQCFLMSFPFQYGRSLSDGGKPFPISPLRPTFPGKKYYISTSSDGHFCQQHYQIIIRLEQTPELKQAPDIKFHLDMFSSAGGRANATIANKMAPGVYSHLLLVDGPPVHIESALIRAFQPSGWPTPFGGWVSGSSGASNMKVLKGDSGHWLRLLNVEINFMSHIQDEVRKQFSSNLCVQGPVREDEWTLELALCRGVRGSLVR